MKLFSYSIEGRASYGLEVSGGLLDLGRRFAPEWPTLKALIAADALARAAALRAEAPDLRFDQVELLPVLPDPGTIVCIGLNYEEHRAETARPVAPHPTVFLRIAESLQAHGSPLLIPRESSQFDYEGELALVIGKAGRRIAEHEAWAHVAGVSCFNDASVRDWQNHTHQFGPGKNFPHTGAFGPALVTLDELPADRVVSVETRVNGRALQQSSTDRMIFPVPGLLAYVSTFMTLQPGDVVVTGTPGGVGAKRQSPLWLAEGDEVEVEIGHVGVLRNRCVKEAA